MRARLKRANKITRNNCRADEKALEEEIDEAAPQAQVG
jgi:hypothetical protein